MNHTTITQRQNIFPCILQSKTHYQLNKSHKRNVSQPNLDNNLSLNKNQYQNQYIKNLRSSVAEFKIHTKKPKNFNNQTQISQKSSQGIREYLNILKNKKNNQNSTKSSSKKQIMHCEQSKTHIKRYHIKISKNSTPRITNLSPFKKLERDIIVNIERILLYYQYLREYGFANTKILALIKRLCQDKRDIEKILVRTKKINIFKNQRVQQYKQNKEDILKCFMDVVSKSGEPQQLFYFFYQFKNQLEKQVIHQATTKIDQISNFILKNQTNQFMQKPKLHEFSQIYEKISTNKDQTFDIQLQIKKIQKFYGFYKNISDVNRKLYQILNQKHQFINTQLQKFHCQAIEL